MFRQIACQATLRLRSRPHLRNTPKLCIFGYSRRYLYVSGQPLPTVDGFKSSEELEKAFHALLAGKNLTFNAVAGAGKTSSMIYLMKLLKLVKPSEDFHMLFLAFNRVIKDETKKKVKQHGLEDNLEVHTYHSAGTWFYSDESCGTDQGLKRLVERKMPLTKDFYPNGARRILVLDELQDMAPPLYNFVRKLMRDLDQQNGGNMQKICLGDPRQSIYGYKDAEPRFLTLSHKIYNTDDLEEQSEKWHTVQATASHRLSQPISNFINNQFIKKTSNEAFIASVGNKTGSEYPKPIYVTCDAYIDAYDIVKANIPDLRSHPEDTIIISPSLKSRFAPIKPLMNRLAAAGYPVFIGTEDAVDRTDRSSWGKIRALTMHQAKGLTAKNVVLIGFDHSYRHYSGKEYQQDGAHLPPIYVALTRPTHKLLLLHHYKEDYIRFIDQSNLEGDCDIHTKKAPEVKAPATSRGRRKVTHVTKLLSHLSERIETECFKKIILQVEKREWLDSNLPQWPRKEIPTGKKTCETVNALTATALVGHAELRQSGTLKMLSDIMIRIERIKAKIVKGKTPSTVNGRLLLHQEDIHEMFQQIQQGRELSPKDMLRLSVLKNMIFSGYINKDITITSQRCKWLDNDFVDEALKWILFYIPKGSDWEVDCGAEVEGYRVDGIIDAITPTEDIYEFKYGLLTASDILQVCCYAALREKSYAYLLEYVSGRRVKIEERSSGAFMKILEDLVKAKYSPSTFEQLSDLKDYKFVNQAKVGFPDFEKSAQSRNGSKGREY